MYGGTEICPLGMSIKDIKKERGKEEKRGGEKKKKGEGKRRKKGRGKEEKRKDPPLPKKFPATNNRSLTL